MELKWFIKKNVSEKPRELRMLDKFNDNIPELPEI